MSVSFFKPRGRACRVGARPARDAASVAPETASAPRNPALVGMGVLLRHRIVVCLDDTRYLFTGLSGLITSATRSLIWSMVSTLLVPKRGMFEHG